MDLHAEDGTAPGVNNFLLLSEDPATVLPARSHLSTLIAGHRRPSSVRGHDARDDGETDSVRRMERMSVVLNTPRMRAERLIGNSNPRYHWQQYWKTEAELAGMSKPLRQYYARNNALIQQYIYIDRLLDSSLPADLLNEYTTQDDLLDAGSMDDLSPTDSLSDESPSRQIKAESVKRVRSRTPRELYRLPPVDETTALLNGDSSEDSPQKKLPDAEDEAVDTADRTVQTAIYLNLAANAVLLLGKLAVILLTDSLSVLASLVDAALDFLSTAIVWITSRLIARQDHYQYPVGRTSLEPLSVVVFATCMMVSFIQVGLECVQRLSSGDRTVISLGLPAILIMVSTVIVKALCWFSCRLVRNTSVQALAQDAMTDVVFNAFSIFFPLVGFYLRLWWLDAIGGLCLALYVIISWGSTAKGHVENLSGQAASSDERNVLLYLTMRFATSIKRIQGLQAYHSGDKLLVEVDIVLDQDMPLKDSHDLAESLQYVLESLPNVQRAFVHSDYVDVNLPTHMSQSNR